VAAAKAIRAGQIGVLFNPTDAQPFHKILPAAVLSPTYKFSDTETGYFSIQHGEKSGVAQFTNGISNQVRPERTTAFELGLKSVLLDKTLILDADIYKMNVLDYQQTTSIVDQYTTALLNDGNIHYTTATGNVPEVESKGVEIDAVYGGFKYTNIRFAGAFTDAKYVSFPNAAQPAEAGYSGAPAYVDLSGRQLPGAAKWTYNTGIDYRRPVQAFGAEREFHSSINVAYTSPWNSDPSLSQYAWISSNYITDFAIGVGNPTKNKYDVTLLVKNLFNDRTPLSRTWTSYSPAISRWFGVVFTGKL
jgi:hypothetical protein